MSEINDAIGTADLAAIDQWHAQLTRNIKGLMAAARADINHEGVGKPVRTYLLAEVIRGHPVIREGLADLLAALIVEVIAEAADIAAAEQRGRQWAIDALRDDGLDRWIGEHRPKTRGPLPLPLLRALLAEYLEALATQPTDTTET